MSGTRVSARASNETPGGSSANYWVTVVYNIAGETFKGQGQTVTITAKCNYNLSAGCSFTLLANETSLGSLKTTSNSTVTYQYVLPDDGADYTLQIQVHAAAVNYTACEAGVTITYLKVE